MSNLLANKQASKQASKQANNSVITLVMKEQIPNPSNADAGYVAAKVLMDSPGGTVTPLPLRSLLLFAVTFSSNDFATAEGLLALRAGVVFLFLAPEEPGVAPSDGVDETLRDFLPFSEPVPVNKTTLHLVK